MYSVQINCARLVGGGSEVTSQSPWKFQRKVIWTFNRYQ